MADMLNAIAGALTGGNTMAGPTMTPMPVGEAYDKMIPREAPEVPEARKELVRQWIKRVTEDKAHWKKAFKRMEKDMSFARKGAPTDWVDAGNYVANIIQRHIAQRVAALYAKNPKAIARRRRRMDFSLWDGNPDSIQAAMKSLQVTDPITGQPAMNPQAVALIRDAAQGYARRQMLDNAAKSLELLYTHQISEQQPPFKKRMKMVVRRAVTTGVGYVKLGFERRYEKNPETVRKAATYEERIARISTLMADLADGEKEKHSAEAEALRIALEALKDDPDVIAYEGLSFEFPASTSIIPDKNCSHLATFAGCNWVTEEHLMTVEEVKDVFEIDLQKGCFRPYIKGVAQNDKQKEGEACVWEVYNKKDGTCFFIVDGYEDFLREPKAPPVRLERFWPWFALTFNDVEDPDHVFPPSDVELLRSMQNEYNRARQGLREHRMANRPTLVTRRGSLSEEDKDILRTRPANAIVELDGLSPQQNVADLLQAPKMPAIEQALYDTEFAFADVLRVAGTQEANLGGTANSTATEASIAEGSRMSALSSNVDDLDDMLTELAREGGQLLLREMSAEQVKKIVGPGAVWPELSAEEIAGEIYLEIEAASSGRPNKAQEIQNFQTIAPILLQVPGVPPRALAKLALQRLDDKMELEDFYQEGLPAITALNQMAASLPAPTAPGAGASPQPADGDPASAPGAQGAEGAMNAPQPPGNVMTPPGMPEQQRGMMVYSGTGERMA